MGLIDDRAETRPARHLRGALLATAQFVQAYFAAALVGQGNDSDWCGSGDHRLDRA